LKTENTKKAPTLENKDDDDDDDDDSFSYICFVLSSVEVISEHELGSTYKIVLKV
jgi:hypothetical protein